MTTLHANLFSRPHIKDSICRKRSVICRGTRYSFPDFIPNPEVLEISDPAGLNMLSRYKATSVNVDSRETAIRTAFVGPNAEDRQATSSSSSEPVLLLHGFDSSAAEWRHTYPLLADKVDTYAVDLLGSGFTDVKTYEDDTSLQLGPEQIREHLHAFWQQEIGKAVTIVGPSLGGATALDFALNHPEAVKNIVLIDAQGYIDGIGPAAAAPRFLSTLGVRFLQTVFLRESANNLVFHNSERWATKDAMRIGRLHTFCPGWLEAKVAFIQSGGYMGIAEKVPDVVQDVLLLWGRQDEILDPKYAKDFERDLQRVRVQMIDQCGHLGHLEQSERVAAEILQFVSDGIAGEMASNLNEPMETAGV